jgi:hypothetical protein
LIVTVSVAGLPQTSHTTIVFSAIVAPLVEERRIIQNAGGSACRRPQGL